MTDPSTRLDPLNSPYPVPWNWVMTMMAENSDLRSPILRYYRSPSLVSPDGNYAAYSRIQLRIHPNPNHTQIASVLFLESLSTGALQVITAASPLADNPFAADASETPPGSIAMIIPVAWSAAGDRILAREFESLFGTGLASDYAVVWDQRQSQAHTIAPTSIDYSNAILLGWSQSDPERILFRAGNMGEDRWPVWAVNLHGQTIAADERDRPVVFGQLVNNIWTGPQSYRG
jgi:hypothetical protein